jgi:hypothetical protein
MLFLSSCDLSGGLFDCDQEKTKIAKSSDEKFNATVLLVQCGATTRDTTWILVSPSGRTANPERDRAAVLEGKDIDVKWTGDALEISYGDATLFQNEPSLHGVAIKYTKRD